MSIPLLSGNFSFCPRNSEDCFLTELAFLKRMTLHSCVIPPRSAFYLLEIYSACVPTESIVVFASSLLCLSEISSYLAWVTYSGQLTCAHANIDEQSMCGGTRDHSTGIAYSSIPVETCFLNSLWRYWCSRQASEPLCVRLLPEHMLSDRRAFFLQ